MKNVGIIIFSIFAFGALISICMSATVYTEGGVVYNTGMLNDRTNYVVVSCTGCVVGMLIFIAGILSEIKETILNNSNQNSHQKLTHSKDQP
jgi:hypothetical protein